MTVSYLLRDLKNLIETTKLLYFKKEALLLAPKKLRPNHERDQRFRLRVKPGKIELLKKSN